MQLNQLHEPALTEFQKLLKWESSLKVDDIVEARFTNAGNCIRFKGRVKKINQKTMLVESIDNNVNGWPAGHTFKIERTSSTIHSRNNGVYPYQEKLTSL